MARKIKFSGNLAKTTIRIPREFKSLIDHEVTDVGVELNREYTLSEAAYEGLKLWLAGRGGARVDTSGKMDDAQMHSLLAEVLPNPAARASVELELKRSVLKVRDQARQHGPKRQKKAV